MMTLNGAYELGMTGPFLVARVVDTLGPGKDGALDAASARLSKDLNRAVTHVGAWPGTIYALWSVDAETSKGQALDLALTSNPDAAVVMTNLNTLVETDVEVVRDLPFLQD